MFWIEDDHDARLRLKGFSATSGAGRHTIRIVLETSDPYALGDALDRLASTQKSQRTKPAPDPKPAAAKRLALPAPARALPKSE